MSGLYSDVFERYVFPIGDALHKGDYEKVSRLLDLAGGRAGIERCLTSSDFKQQSAGLALGIYALAAAGASGKNELFIQTLDWLSGLSVTDPSLHEAEAKAIIKNVRLFAMENPGFPGLESAMKDLPNRPLFRATLKEESLAALHEGNLAKAHMPLVLVADDARLPEDGG